MLKGGFLMIEMKRISIAVTVLKKTYNNLNIVLTIFLFVLFYGTLLGQSDWKDIGPPSQVTFGIYCHPTEANIIYLVVDTGHLFRSMDKGKSWQRISQRVALETMPQRQYRGGEHAVAVDPRPGFGNIVYFSPGQRGAGLWKSTDYGTTWSKTNGSDYLGASVVAVDHNGTVICITGDRKIYSSPDGGDSWSDYLVPFSVQSNWYKPVDYRLDIEITTNNTVWVTNRFEDKGAYYTTDKGQNWNQALVDTWLVDLTCSPVDSNIILALEQDGRIFRSDNGGENFEQTGSVQQNNYWSFNTWPPHKGGISINSTGTVIAIGRYSLARSMDTGQNFVETPEGNLSYCAPDWPFLDRKDTDQALKCCDLSASPVDSSLWIYGDGGMLKKSVDGGQSWVGGVGIGAHGLWMYGNPYPDADDPNVFHVACVDYGHAYTTDLGKTWISTESKRISCQGVTQDPNNHNIYYKTTKKNGSSTLGVYKSTNRGHTFSKLTDISLRDDTYGGRIFVDPTNSQTIYVTIRGGKGVYKSTDGGNSFTNVFTMYMIHHSAITKTGNVFFHIWNGYGLYRYLKDTDQWKDIASWKSVDGFAVHPENENIIFFNAEGVLYKTINGLADSPTWEELGNYAGKQIYIDPYKPDLMLMMTEKKGIGMMISRDGGENWEGINGNLGTSFVWGFVAGGPAAKGRVYAFDATAYYIDSLYDPATAVNSDENETIISQSNILENAYPNPFNPSTNIKYQIAKQAKVSIDIYNSLGELVETLVNEVQEAGYYEVRWNASQFSSGVYLYKLSAGEFVETKKMILLK